MTDKITMIDYGASNIRSALKAFEHLGADVYLTDHPADVAKADKLVLPGVGAFGSGMDALNRLALSKPIQEAAARGVPLLGICVGMQFLFDSSDELGDHRGLGLLPGHITRFDQPDLKVPHMGWNRIEHRAPDHFLLDGIERGSYVYFVHSYHAVTAAEEIVVSSATYGGPFPAVVARDNVYGIQFHPEKSQQTGLRMLKNFITL